MTPWIRCGRFATAALLGLAMMGVCLRPSHPFSSVAVAASPTTAPSINKSNEDGESADSFQAADPDVLQDRFQAVAKRVGPAVVAISAAETASDNGAALRTEEMNTQKLQTMLDKTTRTVGTGFIFDQDGFILTNEHVVEDSQQFWVTTDNHEVYPAIVVAADPRADLAVLKIPMDHLPTVRFASAACQRGQWAITLGNPYGLATEGDMAMSVGIVSATDRSLPRLASKENRLYSNLIQTTAQINPGNSGGPLFDLNGDVIGVNAAVILPQKQTNGIGFAIAVTPQLISEVADLRQGREIVYAYLGVTVTSLTLRERHDMGLADDVGIRVASLETGSPAVMPGAFKEGDIILEFNGQRVGDTDKFVRLVGMAQVNKVVESKVRRDGKIVSVQMTPIKRPVQYTVSFNNQRLYWRGLELGTVPANWPGAAAMTTHGGKQINGILVVGVQDDSPMKKRGISTGSVITAIAGKPVTSMLDVQKILNEVPAEKCDIQVLGSAQVASMQK